MNHEPPQTSIFLVHAYTILHYSFPPFHAGLEVVAVLKCFFALFECWTLNGCFGLGTLFFCHSFLPLFELLSKLCESFPLENIPHAAGLA